MKHSESVDSYNSMGVGLQFNADEINSQNRVSLNRYRPQETESSNRSSESSSDDDNDYDFERMGTSCRRVMQIKRSTDIVYQKQGGSVTNHQQVS